MDIVFEDIRSFNDHYMIEHLLNESAYADIKDYVSKIFNKNKAFKTLFDKFKKAANPVLKRSIALAMLLLLNSNAGEESAANAADRLIDAENTIETPEEFIDFSKTIVPADKTARIEPVKKPTELPKDFDHMSEKEAIELGLIEPVFKVTPKLIGLLNMIHPNRFNTKSIGRYNMYDKAIGLAAAELKEEGEQVDPNLLKGIMFIETHMLPRKNKLGYEGFPQTKMKFVNWVNKKQGQNFDYNSLYDAKESAKLIHYYLKELGNYEAVTNLQDSVVAYNWGAGNLRKYKKKIKKKMPHETQIYVKLLNTILKNASTNV